jgi:hypothetical protein
MDTAKLEFLRIDRDLRERQRAAVKRDHRLFDKSGNPNSVQRALELTEQVGRAEQERETNLNARGTAVATVAGVIATVSGAVVKSVFAPNESDWTDWTKIATLALFAAGLFAVAASMSMAVVAVLRPKRGATTKNFLGDTLTDLWIRGHDELLNADKDRVNLLCLDRAMRTVPQWHIRNRSKSRWLRRAWLFLLAGVVLMAVAAVFILVHLLGIPADGGKQGPATKIDEWEIVAFLAGLAAVAWLAVRTDFPLFARRGDKTSEAVGEIDEIALWLRM